MTTLIKSRYTADEWSEICSIVDGGEETRKSIKTEQSRKELAEVLLDKAAAILRGDYGEPHSPNSDQKWVTDCIDAAKKLVVGIKGRDW